MAHLAAAALQAAVVCLEHAAADIRGETASAAAVVGE